MGCIFSWESWRPFLVAVLSTQATTAKLPTSNLQPPTLPRPAKISFQIWLRASPGGGSLATYPYKLRPHIFSLPSGECTCTPWLRSCSTLCIYLPILMFLSWWVNFDEYCNLWVVTVSGLCLHFRATVVCRRNSLHARTLCTILIKYVNTFAREFICVSFCR